MNSESCVSPGRNQTRMTYRAEGDIATTSPAERRYRRLPAFQRTFSRGSRLGQTGSDWGYMVRRHVGLHMRWDLIAFSTSPANTCSPGQNADRESMVKYAASPEWMLTFLNLRRVQQHQPLGLGKWETHPEPIGCSRVAHHSSITLMPDVQEFNLPCPNPSADRSFSQQEVRTTQDIPLERVLIERVDSSPDSADLWSEPGLKCTLITGTELPHQDLPPFAG